MFYVVIVNFHFLTKYLKIREGYYDFECFRSCGLNFILFSWISLPFVIVYFIVLFSCQGMVTVENVTVVSISTMEELNSIILRGSERRHTSGTQMNDESSRSHLILSIVIESTNLQSQSAARGKVLVVFYL